MQKTSSDEKSFTTQVTKHSHDLNWVRPPTYDNYDSFSTVLFFYFIPKVVKLLSNEHDTEKKTLHLLSIAFKPTAIKTKSFCFSTFSSSRFVVFRSLLFVFANSNRGFVFISSASFSNKGKKGTERLTKSRESLVCDGHWRWTFVALTPRSILKTTIKFAMFALASLPTFLQLIIPPSMLRNILIFPSGKLSLVILTRLVFRLTSDAQI